MKLKANRVIPTVIIIALAGLAVFRFVHKEAPVVEETRPTVSVVLPEKRDIVVLTEAIGTIEPQEEVDVLPKMQGEITAVNFAAGDRVEEGQVLITIHSDALDSLKIAVDSAKIQMNDAATALSRTQALFATGAVSQQQLESAQSAANSTKLAYQNAKKQLELQTGYTNVTAPISGVIETKNVNVHDQASPAMPVCTISGDGGMSVTFGVTESVRKHLNLADEVEVFKGQAELKGHVTEISEKVSATSGLYSCKANIPDTGDADLTSGSRAKVRLVSDRAKGVMTVPVAAVSYASGVPFVYCLEDHLAVKKDLATGLYDETYMEVTEGLADTDQVIVTWSNEIYNGAEVRTVEEAQAAAAAE